MAQWLSRASATFKLYGACLLLWCT